MGNDLRQQQMQQLRQQHQRFAEQSRHAMQAQMEQLHQHMKRAQQRANTSRTTTRAPRAPQPAPPSTPVSVPTQSREASPAQLPFSARPLAFTGTVLAVSAVISIFLVLTVVNRTFGVLWFVILTSVPTVVALIYSALQHSHLLAEETAATTASSAPLSAPTAYAAAPLSAAAVAVPAQPLRAVNLTAQQALAWAKQLYSQGNFASCARVLDRLLLEGSVRAQALYWLGLVHFAQHRLIAAAGCFLQASAENPRDANSLYYLGRISQLEGNALTAAQMYAAAIALNPAHRSALAAIARI